MGGQCPLPRRRRLLDPEPYPTEDDLERQYAKSVGPFVYVPLTLPEEEPPTVLTEEEA